MNETLERYVNYHRSKLIGYETIWKDLAQKAKRIQSK
jgi:hypothetical protein